MQNRKGSSTLRECLRVEFTPLGQPIKYSRAVTEMHEDFIAKQQLSVTVIFSYMLSITSTVFLAFR